jgi:hypothetical protein
VHYFTGGVPRLINLLCDQAMAYSFSEERRRISSVFIREVVADRNQTGLSAFRPLPVPLKDGTVTEFRPILDALKHEAAE